MAYATTDDIKDAAGGLVTFVQIFDWDDDGDASSGEDAARIVRMQAEVEAKVRRVQRFREQMRKIEAPGRADLKQRERMARALITQVDDMIETNLIVRDTLHELRETAEAVLNDLTE